MTHLVLSCSLSQDSYSRRLAHMATGQLRAAGQGVQLLDLRAYPLPPFDNDTVFQDATFRALHGAIAAADGVVICSPVYNWALTGGLKSLIEATGAVGPQGPGCAWFDKVVSFACAGGAAESYTAFTTMAASLLLDFKCVIAPYPVFVTPEAWLDDSRLTPDRAERLARAMTVHAELTTLLSARSYRSEWGL